MSNQEHDQKTSLSFSDDDIAKLARYVGLLIEIDRRNKNSTPLQERSAVRKEAKQ